LKEIFNSNPTEQVEISSLGDFADLNSLWIINTEINFSVVWYNIFKFPLSNSQISPQQLYSILSIIKKRWSSPHNLSKQLDSDRINGRSRFWAIFAFRICWKELLNLNIQLTWRFEKNNQNAFELCHWNSVIQWGSQIKRWRWENKKLNKFEKDHSEEEINWYHLFQCSVGQIWKYALSQSGISSLTFVP
jgi:hypothetical protein